MLLPRAQLGRRTDARPLSPAAPAGPHGGLGRAAPVRAGHLRFDGLVGLLRGKQALATWDVAALLRDEFLARVLVPQVARHPASALRGDRHLVGRLEADTRESLAGTLGLFGLRLEGFSVTWGLTEQERAEVDRRRRERAEEAYRFETDRKIAQMARTWEIRKAHAALLQELRAAAAAGEAGHQKLLLAAAHERDLLTKSHHLDLARVQARISEIGLEIETYAARIRLEQARAAQELRLERDRAEQELRLDVREREFRQAQADRLARLDLDDKALWSKVKMQIELATRKHEREMAGRRQELEAEYRRLRADIEDRYEQRRLKLDESLARMGMMERLVSQGLSTGAADPAVLKAMLEQATEQEYATASDEKARARAEAQGAGKGLDAYRAAQADERAHQTTMTGLSAQLMAAAKQPPPPVLLTGVPVASPVPAAPGTVPPPQETPPGAAACCPNPGCGRPVQAGWKTCPYCGGPLVGRAARCPHCQGEWQPAWKACPACGTAAGPA